MRWVALHGPRRAGNPALKFCHHQHDDGTRLFLSLRAARTRTHEAGSDLGQDVFGMLADGQTGRRVCAACGGGGRGGGSLSSISTVPHTHTTPKAKLPVQTAPLARKFSIPPRSCGQGQSQWPLVAAAESLGLQLQTHLCVFRHAAGVALSATAAPSRQGSPDRRRSNIGQPCQFPHESPL